MASLLCFLGGKKKKKSFHTRRRRDKVGEEFPLRVPSLLCFLCAKKKKKKGFHTKKTRGQSRRRIPLRVPSLLCFLGVKKKKVKAFHTKKTKGQSARRSIPASCTFAAVFPWCEEKEGEGFSHEEDEGTKCAKNSPSCAFAS